MSGYWDDLRAFLIELAVKVFVDVEVPNPYACPAKLFSDESVKKICWWFGVTQEINLLRSGKDRDKIHKPCWLV